MATVLLSPADAGLAEQLERAQVSVIGWPEPFIAEARDYATLDEAIENLFGYDWLLLKNTLAAEFFLRRFELQHRLDQLDDLRVLAIGQETIDRLTTSHLHVDVAIERFALGTVYSAIESYLGDRDSLTRLNLLVPSASITRERFEHQLEDAGARVDNVTAYRTTAETSRLARLKSLTTGGGIDAILLGNSAELEALARILDTDDLGRLLTGVRAICAHDDTAELAGWCGLTDASVPLEWTAAMITNLLARPEPAAAS